MPDYTIPNLRNACRILDLLSNSEVALGNAEISDQLEIPRSTTLRILSTLESQNYVRKNQKRYRLGIALIHLGASASAQHSLRKLCMPILKRITEITDETCHLVSMSQDKTLILQVCVSAHPMSAHSKPGTLADLHCSAGGKVLLANLPESKRGIIKQLKLTRRTRYTITDISTFENTLEQVKEQGYSMDEQEYHEGIRCIAVPVYNDKDEVPYAIGITASTSRFTKQRIPTVRKQLQECSSELSKILKLQLSADF